MTKSYMRNHVIRESAPKTDRIAGQLNTPTAYSRLERERTTLGGDTGSPTATVCF